MRVKILIVDDEADLRRLLRGILEPVAQVFEAESGEEALRVLRREKPALMFLDVTMPGIGGLEALKRARAQAPGLAVVMLTGEVDLGIARGALVDGARAYITKPFAPESVRAEVLRLAEAGEAVNPSGAPWRVREKGPPPAS